MAVYESGIFIKYDGTNNWKLYFHDKFDPQIVRIVNQSDILIGTLRIWVVKKI